MLLRCKETPQLLIKKLIIFILKGGGARHNFFSYIATMNDKVA